MFKLMAICIMLCVSPAFAQVNPAEITAAQDADQLVVVAGTKGSDAMFSFYEKDEAGNWKELISCPAYIGKNGWGKTREGDMKTPAGVYTFTMAFGINPDPGSPMGYTQVDETHYWVGDSNSDRYNQFVSTRDYDAFDKKESERITDYTQAYKYCLNISWNMDRTPKKGSAIFLHCYSKNKFTAGCVAVPEAVMREMVQRVKPGCVVVMDTSANIGKY